MTKKKKKVDCQGLLLTLRDRCVQQAPVHDAHSTPLASRTHHRSFPSLGRPAAILALELTQPRAILHATARFSVCPPPPPNDSSQPGAAICPQPTVPSGGTISKKEASRRRPSCLPVCCFGRRCFFRGHVVLRHVRIRSETTQNSPQGVGVQRPPMCDTETRHHGVADWHAVCWLEASARCQCPRVQG